jgi:hypothetical protein
MVCTDECVKPSRTQAHCSAAGCHRTFGSVSAFDEHRVGGKCLDPEGRGLYVRDRIWRRPPDSRNVERFTRLREAEGR